MPPEEAPWLWDGEQVFGVEIEGDARAYPHRVMDWHEMANDTVGGVPVALAYCTLCGSGVLFESEVAGRAAPFEFGSSGRLYRSNKLMYDRETLSLWNHYTGQPVVGPLARETIELKTRPLAVLRWADWKRRYPKTRVLSLDTGHRRDYTPGRPYGDYFASSGLMFPARTDDATLRPKDIVLAVRDGGRHRAWPMRLFRGGRVLNDAIGTRPVVVVGDGWSDTLRVWERADLTFDSRLDGPASTPEALYDAAGTRWRVTEEALIAPDGRRLARLPAHNAYWFAFAGFTGRNGSVFTE